jgi:alkylhydroperoxidase/carboxymuconolactone decarboxylase family protein YurZ
MPDSTIELSWELVKRTQFEKGAIPHKYRELMGLAICTATRDHYGIWNFTETARLFGASEEEIEETVRYATVLPGLMTYAEGLQTSFAHFREQVGEAVKHYKSKHR